MSCSITQRKDRRGPFPPQLLLHKSTTRDAGYPASLSAVSPFPIDVLRAVSKSPREGSPLPFISRSSDGPSHELPSHHVQIASPTLQALDPSLPCWRCAHHRTGWSGSDSFCRDAAFSARCAECSQDSAPLYPPIPGAMHASSPGPINTSASRFALCMKQTCLWVPDLALRPIREWVARRAAIVKSPISAGSFAGGGRLGFLALRRATDRAVGHPAARPAAAYRRRGSR